VPREEEANHANRMVANRPVESWTTVNNTAPVAVEVGSPTPTPRLTETRINLGELRDLQGEELLG